MAVFGAGTAPVVWTFAVSHRFQAHRGLALGLVLSGTGVCAAVVPKLAAWALAGPAGWRGAYFCLASAPLLLTVPLVLFGLRMPFTSRPKAEPARAGGLGLREALRTAQFWILVTSTLAIYSGGAGLIFNLVPFLTDQGLSLAEATDLAAILGVSSIVSRLASGALADRFWAPGVSAFLVLTAGLAVCSLAGTGVSRAMAVAVAVALGLVAGAELDLLAFMTARYFGLAAYGRIYGTFFSILAVAGGAAPLIFARLHPQVAVPLVGGLLLAGGCLVLLMGPYPQRGPATATSERT